MRNILVLGGGHGLSAVVEALKKENDYNLKALISTSDSGGHTGKIIEEFSVPAVGDIRRNLAATVDSFPLLQKMLDYRFDSLHGQKNVSLGNLMLLSLLDSFSFEDLMLEIQKEFKTKVLLVPLYNQTIDLCAKYMDGTYGKKEHLIPCEGKKIDDVYYQEEVNLSNRVISSINEADAIIIGPGSLFTSIGAVLADLTVSNLVKKSNSKIIYICNIMTEPYETDNFDILDHVNFIERKIGKIDYVIANKTKLTLKQKKKYALEQAFQVKNNKDKRIIYRHLLDKNQDVVRHDSNKLKKVLREIIDN